MHHGTRLGVKWLVLEHDLRNSLQTGDPAAWREAWRRAGATYTHTCAQRGPRHSENGVNTYQEVAPRP